MTALIHTYDPTPYPLRVTRARNTGGPEPDWDELRAVYRELKDAAIAATGVLTNEDLLQAGFAADEIAILATGEAFAGFGAGFDAAGILPLPRPGRWPPPAPLPRLASADELAALSAGLAATCTTVAGMHETMAQMTATIVAAQHTIAALAGDIAALRHQQPGQIATAVDAALAEALERMNAHFDKLAAAAAR